MLTEKLPQGIRNLNPGNLRQSYGLKKPTVLVNGYAKFETFADGLQSLASLTSDFYEIHGLTTLPQFIARYAPASENDVLQYQRNMLSIMGAPYIGSDKQDLMLHRSWNALKFMRAIVICECGHPPADWEIEGEWFDLITWTTAMSRSNRWHVV